MEVLNIYREVGVILMTFPLHCSHKSKLSKQEIQSGAGSLIETTRPKSSTRTKEAAEAITLESVRPYLNARPRTLIILERKKVKTCLLRHISEKRSI